MADNKIENVETIEEAKETTQPVVIPDAPKTKKRKITSLKKLARNSKKPIQNSKR